MPGKKKPLKGNSRSAKTGRFVTNRYAESHPATTVTKRPKKKVRKKK